jgi:hypothetical protein
MSDSEKGEEQTESLERDVVPLVEISWKGSVVPGSSGLGVLQQSTFHPILQSRNILIGTVRRQKWNPFLGVSSINSK